MKKETVVKVVAILILPGGIPIYLSYKAYQIGKRIYDLNKKAKDAEEKPE